MKQLLFLLLFPCLALAQYTGNAGQKITLGEQTSADGLVYRGVLNDTSLITPFSDTSAYIILDTVNNRFYNYNRATNVWSLAGGGVSVSSFSAGSTGLTPSTATTGAVTLGGTLAVVNGGTGATTLAAALINTGSGTSNYLPKYTGSTTFGNSLIYDNGSNVGIGTTNVAFDAGSGLRIDRSGVSTIRLTGQSSAVEMSMTSSGYQIDSRVGYIRFITGANDGVATEKMRITSAGNVGIGTESPTAVLHLKAGTATASTAPLKFTSGVNLTSPLGGEMEFNGTNLFFSPSTTRHTVNHGLTGSATLNFPSTTTLLSADLTITVTGAADGDVVSLGVPNAAVNANTCYTAWVSAANTVTVRFNNYSSGTVDPASASFKVFVTK